MGPHCILESVAILEAPSTVSTIVCDSERAYSIWPPDSMAKQALRVWGGVCAKAQGENEMEECTQQRLRVHI